MGRASAHLAVELFGAGRHPEAHRHPEWDRAAVLTPEYQVGLVGQAARAGVDLVVLADSIVPPDGEDPVPVLDAVAIGARVAPAVPWIGLVPAVTVTHTEPFHVATSIATLDIVSGGRAGWEPVVSRTAAEAELFGRKPAAPVADLWREAAEAIEVVVRLWDSWEDDAVIRDAATGRYVDRDKLHYIDFAGEFFAVKGPSITPRSPQAHPLVVLRGDEPEALAVAAAWAEVIRIAAPDLAAAHAARERCTRPSPGPAASPAPSPCCSTSRYCSGRCPPRARRARRGHPPRTGLASTPRTRWWTSSRRPCERVSPTASRPCRSCCRAGCARSPTRSRPGSSNGGCGRPSPQGRPCASASACLDPPTTSCRLVWCGATPESGSQTDFSSFVHFAQTAERGLFDFLFLAEGLRLREHRDRIHDLDVVGRPDTLTVLNAIAAVTTRLGLGGTLNTTFNEPYELPSGSPRWTTSRAGGPREPRHQL